MLFLLTGNVQIGKTRWLSRVVEELADRGVSSAGVLAPGVWREREQESAPDGPGGAAGTGSFEKLGIDNVLLPGGKRISFARRRDLALAEGVYDKGSQSARAKMAWEISDEAIAQVNSHFNDLPHIASSPSLLVVDELGQLELLRGGGLACAMALLEKGPSSQFPCAVVIVREWLLESAIDRFSKVWGTPCAISPDDAAREAILNSF